MKKNQNMKLVQAKTFLAKNTPVAVYGHHAVFKDGDSFAVLQEQLPRATMPTETAIIVLDVFDTLHEATALAADQDKAFRKHN